MNQQERRAKIMAVLRVASGNFLEMYDFMVFGYYAAAIGKAYFPGSSDFATLMKSLMVFGAGFLMRPIGALVLGAFIDRHGRRAGLILTLALMSVGTLALAALPGYASIGVMAPVLILISRLLQGFSAGVELGGVSVYLSEIATPGNKGFYVSWQSGSQQVSVICAAAIGVLLANILSPGAMESWGWRIPLLAGCAIIPFLFYMRAGLEETETFTQQKSHPTMGEICRSAAANWPLVVLGTLMVTMTTVAFYLITAYTPTFGSAVLKLSPMDALIVTFCVGVSNFFWLPVSGALSDRIGRRPILIAMTLLTVLTAYPAMSWLAQAPSFTKLLTVELWLSFIYGCYNGAMVVFLTEIMPARLRTTGFSLAYSLATATFGGFTPAACTWLIQTTGNKAMPGAWVSGAAVLGLIAVLIHGAMNRAKSGSDGVRLAEAGE